MSRSQRSSSSTVRQLAVGKEPITPARQAALTSAGPDTRNIGAAISGRRRRLLSEAGNDMGGDYLSAGGREAGSRPSPAAQQRGDAGHNPPSQRSRPAPRRRSRWSRAAPAPGRAGGHGPPPDTQG